MPKVWRKTLKSKIKKSPSPLPSPKPKPKPVPERISLTEKTLQKSEPEKTSASNIQIQKFIYIPQYKKPLATSEIEMSKKSSLKTKDSFPKFISPIMPTSRMTTTMTTTTTTTTSSSEAKKTILEPIPRKSSSLKSDDDSDTSSFSSEEADNYTSSKKTGARSEIADMFERMQIAINSVHPKIPQNDKEIVQKMALDSTVKLILHEAYIYGAEVCGWRTASVQFVSLDSDAKQVEVKPEGKLQEKQIKITPPPPKYAKIEPKFKSKSKTKIPPTLPQVEIEEGEILGSDSEIESPGSFKSKHKLSPESSTSSDSKTKPKPRPRPKNITRIRPRFEIDDLTSRLTKMISKIPGIIVNTKGRIKLDIIFETSVNVVICEACIVGTEFAVEIVDSVPSSSKFKLKTEDKSESEIKSAPATTSTSTSTSKATPAYFGDKILVGSKTIQAKELSKIIGMMAKGIDSLSKKRKSSECDEWLEKLGKEKNSNSSLYKLWETLLELVERGNTIRSIISDVFCLESKEGKTGLKSKEVDEYVNKAVARACSLGFLLNGTIFEVNKCLPKLIAMLPD